MLAACAGVAPSQRLTAEMPRQEAFRTEVKQDPSTVNVGVEMSAAELADTLNRVVPHELYRGSTSTDLPFAVTRKGPIAVTLADNRCQVTIPAGISLGYGIIQTPPLSIRLRFEVGARVTPDWKVTAEVRFLGLSEALPEELRVGPFSVKPKSLVSDMTRPLQGTLSKLATTKLNEKFDLKGKVAKVWTDAQQPLLLDSRYGAWLVMAPREVVLYPLSLQRDRMKVAVGVTSLARVVVGPRPAAARPVPLPPLKLAGGSDRSFKISLATDLFYHDLAKAAGPLLIGKELGQDGKSVILKSIDVSGNGDHLQVKVEMTGTVEGTFYLTGRPVFKAETNRFAMEDVDFDLQTKSLLVRSADWLLHGTFRRTIEEKLSMDLTLRLEQARELAGKSLDRVKLADNVYLSGKLNALRLNDLLVQQDRLSLQLLMEGESGIIFH
ncbi:DUF4403 family protein [Geomonas sp. Red32]|uniref:DUF4403 family protein n=1 Tax=Geomonas sp. Red32 TaxID=2912856 RepID=UPI00202CF58C|nr:DUF4403 family protein [Geomonas sp. Red32]MCM0080428.1 DUF4403 family protein [Geomonas sp. Red32]